jgi:hypothetical protein
MIIEVEIISQPYSGEFIEKIYDNESAWNSQSWTFIKFVNDDYSEWCGHFRGFPRQAAISFAHNLILVLTSDYLYMLNRDEGSLLELEERPSYHSLTVDPNGNFILADYYNFTRIATSIKNKEDIESSVQMDMIEFGNWVDDKLEFTCNEFMNWDRSLFMVYDSEANKIEIKSV